jgi:hypothetical protein
MTDKILKKSESTKVVINPIVAAVTGAIVGAGVVVAGAAVMKDKQFRDQVQQKKNEADQKLKQVLI